MKIPANKVPAQVWADKAKAHVLGLTNVERQVLEDWEGSKQVYRVNDALWDEMSVDEAEELPMSLLGRLPYDCLFIQHRETVDLPTIPTIDGGNLSPVIEREGYFCFRDEYGLHIAALIGHADVFKHAENTLVPMPVTLDNCKNIVECVDAAKTGMCALALRSRQMTKAVLGRFPKDDNVIYMSKAMIEVMGTSDLGNILGTLMYISSKEADVRTVYVPQRNQPRRSRQTDCTIHDVGFRIAPQLAEVRRVYEHDAQVRSGAETGRHVAPHIRRGHWHGYWTGPRENPTGLEIKWIAPTVVNASRGELEGTVHEVGGRDERYTLKSTQRDCDMASRQLDVEGRTGEQTRENGDTSR